MWVDKLDNQNIQQIAADIKKWDGPVLIPGAMPERRICNCPLCWILDWLAARSRRRREARERMLTKMGVSNGFYVNDGDLCVSCNRTLVVQVTQIGAQNLTLRWCPNEQCRRYGLLSSAGTPVRHK